VTSRRVLLVYHDLSQGGLAVDVRNLSSGLLDRGWEIDVATVVSGHQGRSDGLALDPRVRRHELRALRPERTAQRLGAAAGIGRVVRKTQPSIVHVISCLPMYVHFAAMRAARPAGSVLVWTPMTHPGRARIWSSYRPWIRWPMTVFDAVAPLACRRVDAVFAATEAEAEDFRRRRAHRIEMIPPAVEDRARVPPGRALGFRSSIGLRDRPLVLVVAGRDEPRKGLGFARDAIRRLREVLPPAMLVLVGGIEPSSEAARDVILAGRLSDAELARAYAAADVVFVPSRFEAFSRVVIEAWQQSRPVVVSDGVGLASTVETGGGLVVPFGDARAASEALLEVLLDDERAASMGDWGRAQVEKHYRLAEVLDRTESTYEELLASQHEHAMASASDRTHR
jgi:glycosyltransferase involved in cell wall biosynthesis